MARPEISGRKPRTTAVTLRRSRPPRQSKPEIKASETTTTAETTTAETTSTETVTEAKAPEVEAVATRTTPRLNETVTSPRIRGPPTAVLGGNLHSAVRWAGRPLSGVRSPRDPPAQTRSLLHGDFER